MSEETEKQKQPKVMPLLYFVDQGLSIRPWMIRTMEKAEAYLTRNTTVYKEYSIVFNAGLEPSVENPVGEKILRFEKREDRDNKYELILMKLEELDNKVIRL